MPEDEKKIREIISEWSRALEAKDTATMMKHYLPESVLYDAIPPYKVEGQEKIQAAWDCCLPYFPDEFRSEHRDLVVQVGGDVAFVHGLHKFVTSQDHPCSQAWMRITVGYRKIEGEWKVSHEHVSLPFNPIDNQSWKIKDPAVADQPDYGGCGPEPTREETLS